MKFILVITMCSSLQQSCMPPVQVKEVFNSHYECAYQGYTTSAEIIKNLGEEQVNKDKMYLSFACKQTDSF